MQCCTLRVRRLVQARLCLPVRLWGKRCLLPRRPAPTVPEMFADGVCDRSQWRLLRRRLLLQRVEVQFLQLVRCWSRWRMFWR